jgi:predicted dehydrogenase
VSGKTRIGVAPRRVPRENGTVTEIPVAVPTHAAAVLTFKSGVVGALVASYDIWDNQLPFIEIYGTEGTLAVPHPNWFTGEVRVKLHDDSDWRVVPDVIPSLQGEGMEGSMLRGMGVLDLVDSLAGAPQRTNVEVAYHTLEALEAVQVASDTSTVVTLRSTCERPAPLTKEQLASWSAIAADSGSEDVRGEPPPER